MSDCKQNCDDKRGDHKDHGLGQDLGDLHKMAGKDMQQDSNKCPFIQKMKKEDKEEGCGGQKCDEKKKCGDKDKECH